MKSKQFAWIYLIEHGLAGHKPSYYGGFDVEDNRLKGKTKVYSLEDNTTELARKLYLTEIKAYGVNWDKTEAPRSNSVSRFNGTFAEESEEEYLEGVLVLNSGTKQTWVAEALEVKNVFDMMEQASEAEKKFKEIFG